MKKVLALIFVCLMLLSLCACGEDVAQNTEPATTACSHSWVDANCTTAKTCSKCGTTEGTAPGHNYTDGACSVCGIADPNVPFTGNSWVAHIVRPSGYTDAEAGEVLSVYSLVPTDFEGYFHKDYYSNPSYEGEPFDSIVYNEKTYYDYWFSSNMNGIEWEDQGNTVTVRFIYEDPVTELVLTRTGETEFTVTASNDESRIPVGTVFTSKS